MIWRRPASAVLVALVCHMGGVGLLLAAASGVQAFRGPQGHSASSRSAQQSITITLRGRVVNVSQGGAGVTGATVDATPARRVNNGEAPGGTAAVLRATTGPDGAFALYGMVPDTSYRLVATYRGVSFTQSLTVTAAQVQSGWLDQPLTVFEPDPDVGLQIRTAHIALAPYPDDALLRAAEVWVVRNNSDRAWVSDGRRWAFDLQLPAATAMLRAEAQGEEMRRQAGRVLDDKPLPPGERQATLTYLLPYDGSSLVIERQLSWPTAELRLIVAWPGAIIDSAQLTETEQAQISGMAVTMARGRNLPAGTRVVAVIRGLPVPPNSNPAGVATVASQEALMGLALGFGLVASLLALAYGWQHRPIADQVRSEDAGVGEPAGGH